MGAATYPRMMKKAVWTSLPWSVILVWPGRLGPGVGGFRHLNLGSKENQMVGSKRGKQEKRQTLCANKGRKEGRKREA